MPSIHNPVSQDYASFGPARGSAVLSFDQVRAAVKVLLQIKEEVSRTVVGQEAVIEGLLRALLCDGHVLLEGVPGIAKTLVIKTLAAVTGSSSTRVQFTVDLLPSDIIGLTTFTPGKGFETIKGPIFANYVVADEINRSPPKTQSALIEAMQEKQVTIARKTYPLPIPFFVMANQNPLETSGVYPLPEAQVDRFLFKLIMTYPQAEEEFRILEENTTLRAFDSIKLRAITSPAQLIQMQNLVKEVYLDPSIKSYIVEIVRKTRDKAFKYAEFIEWGCSPRASIALFIAAKAHAFMQGRNFVIPRDVKDVAHDCLRHRILLSYRARAENITSDTIISHILEKEVAAP